jgi:hypothetical protein
MSVTSPLLKGVSQVVALPCDSLTSSLKTFGEFTGRFDDDPDGTLGLVRASLAGAATALAGRDRAFASWYRTCPAVPNASSSYAWPLIQALGRVRAVAPRRSRRPARRERAQHGKSARRLCDPLSRAVKSPRFPQLLGLMS